MGGAFPRGAHLHHSWELKVVARGSLLCLYPDGEERIEAPTVLLIPPRVLHYSDDTTAMGPDTEAFNLVCEEAGTYVGVIARTSREVCFVDEDEVRRWSESLGGRPAVLLDRLSQSMARGEDCSNTIRQILLCLAGVIRARSEEGEESHPLVVRAINLMRAGYFNPSLSVESLAKMLKVTPNHLSFLFRKHTGETARRTLIGMRLARAHELLRQEPCSVKEAAWMTGWRSPYHFSSSFSRHFGYPPSEASRHSISG
jgi:AraC-like DNA-binding protein